MLLSTKDLKWQMVRQSSEKLVEQFIGPYKIKAVISSNVVELELLATVRIHLVVNVSQIKRYVDQVDARGRKHHNLWLSKGKKNGKWRRY